MFRNSKLLGGILIAASIVGAIAIAQVPPAATEGPAIAPVVLSKQHEALTKVKAGDEFPSLELANLSGGSQSLSELYGKNATVVLFWQNNGWITRAALRDLGLDISEPFGKQGAEVVTVAVNQPADAAQATLDKSESKLTTLLDAEGKAFAQIGSEKLPRIFVPDNAGKIVWFDLEYSHSTRRELKQAVQKLVE